MFSLFFLTADIKSQTLCPSGPQCRGHIAVLWCSHRWLRQRTSAQTVHGWWTCRCGLHSGLQLSRTRPPLQLGPASPSGRRRPQPESRSWLCQGKRPEEEKPERVHKQQTAAAEEPNPSSQSGGECIPDSALQAQIKKAVKPDRHLKPPALPWCWHGAQASLYGQTPCSDKTPPGQLILA